MKAKDLYVKYKDGAMSQEKDVYLPAVRGLVSELIDEIKAIAEVRHVQFDRGLLPIMREQNDKYKAIVRMFEKEYGASPIKPDGFEIVLEDLFPGVTKKMRRRRNAGR